MTIKIIMHIMIPQKSYTLLYLSLLLCSFAFLDAASFPPCHPHDKAVLLKIQDQLGDPAGQLSSWERNTDCCLDWSYVGCPTHSKGPYARVSSLTFGYNLDLTGDFPSEFGDLPFLTTLSFAHETNVTGTIPKSLGKLKSLFLLELSSNSLTGHIPKELLRLKNLTLVDLSGNHLSGLIPSADSLPSLLQFNVSHNELSGPIPAALKQFGRTSFQYNKGLCGPPLAACK